MSEFIKVKPNDSCANCHWFEINIQPVSNTYYETELEITCTTEHTRWHFDLTPDKGTDAIGSPDEMKCHRWEAAAASPPTE